jgi:hypothetical protein
LPGGQSSDLADALRNACSSSGSNLDIADKSSGFCLIESTLTATVCVDTSGGSNSYPNNSTHDLELPHAPDGHDTR